MTHTQEVLMAGIRWGWVLLAGVLAEVAVILVLLAITTAHSLWIAPGKTEAEYQDFAEAAGYYVAPTGGAVAVFLMVLWVGRKLSSAFVANGVLVGLVGVVLTIGFIAGARPEHRWMYVISWVLRIVAGYAGGVVLKKRFERREVPAT